MDSLDWLKAVASVDAYMALVMLSVWLLIFAPAHLLGRLSLREGIQPESKWSPLTYSVTIFTGLCWVLAGQSSYCELTWQGVGRLRPVLWWAALVGPPFVCHYWTSTQKGRLSTLRLVLLGFAGLAAMGWIDLFSYRLLSPN